MSSHAGNTHESRPQFEILREKMLSYYVTEHRLKAFSFSTRCLGCIGSRRSVRATANIALFGQDVKKGLGISATLNVKKEGIVLALREKATWRQCLAIRNEAS